MGQVVVVVHQSLKVLHLVVAAEEEPVDTDQILQAYRGRLVPEAEEEAEALILFRVRRGQVVPESSSSRILKFFKLTGVCK
jgi:hypothetical protein